MFEYEQYFFFDSLVLEIPVVFCWAVDIFSRSGMNYAERLKVDQQGEEIS